MIGSGYDIAVATYGKSLMSAILYKQSGQVKQIDLPPSLKVCVGFVGQSSSTTELVKAMNVFKNKNKKTYQEICASITKVVTLLIEAIEKNSQNKILFLIKRNRKLLKQLSVSSGIVLETPELKTLCDVAEEYGSAAKLSGAGGGDCGIALCFDDMTAKKITTKWEKNGITPVGIIPGRIIFPQPFYLRQRS